MKISFTLFITIKVENLLLWVTLNDAWFYANIFAIFCIIVTSARVWHNLDTSVSQQTVIIGIKVILYKMDSQRKRAYLLIKCFDAYRNKGQNYDTKTGFGLPSTVDKARLLIGTAHRFWNSIGWISPLAWNYHWLKILTVFSGAYYSLETRVPC